MRRACHSPSFSFFLEKRFYADELLSVNELELGTSRLSPGFCLSPGFVVARFCQRAADQRLREKLSGQIPGGLSVVARYLRSVPHSDTLMVL